MIIVTPILMDFISVFLVREPYKFTIVYSKSSSCGCFLNFPSHIRDPIVSGVCVLIIALVLISSWFYVYKQYFLKFKFLWLFTKYLIIFLFVFHE
jgi:hypothetical protein